MKNASLLLTTYVCILVLAMAAGMYQLLHWGGGGGRVAWFDQLINQVIKTND